MAHIKTENKNFVKDTRTGLVTNVSKTGYKEFSMQKNRVKKIHETENELKDTKKTLKDVQSELNDIKSMLNQVLENRK